MKNSSLLARLIFMVAMVAGSFLFILFLVASFWLKYFHLWWFQLKLVMINFFSRFRFFVNVLRLVTIDFFGEFWFFLYKTSNKTQDEKGSNPGIYKVSNALVSRIMSLPKKSERIFPASRGSVCANFIKARKRLARKFQNPRLLRITFHTIRHWKATMEYHRTKDIIHVKENILRHRSILNTMIYIHLRARAHVRVAKNVKDACELVKTGFQYVTGEYDDGGKIFRKRK